MEFTPFGRVLRDLLIEREITTGLGNPNWSAFAELVDGVHYETLRKAVTGERRVTPELIEAVSDTLGVDPAATFVEYRLWQVQRLYDPREVGSEEALKNLEEWVKLHKKPNRSSGK